MLTYAFLAGAAMLTTPALAQETPGTRPVAQPAPTTVDQAGPAPQAPASSSTDSSLPPSTVAQDATASAQPTPPTQVAEVVNSEFASYDKNRHGVLNAIEFDAWMVALKTASDPSTKATSPTTKTWLTRAFAQADTDKNKRVSKTELTGFLSAQG